MWADIKIFNIDPFIDTPDTTPVFPNIPDDIKKDVNQTASKNIENLKNSFVNFNVIWWNFWNLDIDWISSDFKLTDIPKVIPSNNDFNSNNKEYSTIWNLNIEFKWSFKVLDIKYSVIKKDDNTLELTFYSLNKNNQIKETSAITINKQDWIKKYDIKFDKFNWWNFLWTNNLNLEINIDWK